MVTAKIEIIVRANAAKVPVISCMGAGNKTEPAMLKAGNLFETSVCPLAKIMRKEIKERGITAVKVVYSEEPPVKAPHPLPPPTEGNFTRVIGSTSFVPPAAGLLMASEIIKDLIK